jgi:hypothetical protein
MAELLITRLAHAIQRRCGHTAAAVSSGALVLTRDAREADRIERKYETDALTVSHPDALRGRRVPMVVDPSALDTLSADAERTVAQLVDERDGLRRDNVRWQDETQRLRARVAELEAELETESKRRRMAVAKAARNREIADVANAKVAELEARLIATPEIVERCARAIHAVPAEELAMANGEAPRLWEALEEWERDEYREWARAALSALRGEGDNA